MTKFRRPSEPITVQPFPVIFPITVPILGVSGLLAKRSAPERFTEPRNVAGFPVQLSVSSVAEVLLRMRRHEFSQLSWHGLVGTLRRISTAEENRRFLIFQHLQDRWRQAGVILYPHQVGVLTRVVERMQGRALLADEVGLGKTVEAGMIVREYMLRGLARKILILTPASLCWQWFWELREKFGIYASLQRTARDWEYSDILIASLDTAKRSPHRDEVLAQTYDIVVVDEAHRLKNKRTSNFQLVQDLSTRFLLLLTATPVQNDIEELFNLVEIVNPGQLGTRRRFKTTFLAGKRAPKNPEELRPLLARAMIRNRRGRGSVELPKRNVHTVSVDFSAAERTLYDEVTDFTRRFRQKLPWDNLLPLLTLQREACSSSAALLSTLQKMGTTWSSREAQSHLARLGELCLAAGDSAKAEQLDRIVRDLGDKTIIFTEFLATQDYLAGRLASNGLRVLTFDGSLSPGQREWVRALFKAQGDVLVSSEAGGEGLNFQFCRNVINFDLPWNPMRIEQRIGRVHRLGQTREVNVFNFSTRRTIEEYVLYLLHEKIDLFRNVVGELEMIVAKTKLERSFEAELAGILSEASDEQEVRKRLDELGETFLESVGRSEDGWTEICPAGEAGTPRSSAWEPLGVHPAANPWEGPPGSDGEGPPAPSSSGSPQGMGYRELPTQVEMAPEAQRVPGSPGMGPASGLASDIRGALVPSAPESPETTGTAGVQSSPVAVSTALNECVTRFVLLSGGSVSRETTTRAGVGQIPGESASELTMESSVEPGTALEAEPAVRLTTKPVLTFPSRSASEPTANPADESSLPPSTPPRTMPEGHLSTDLVRVILPERVAQELGYPRGQVETLIAFSEEARKSHPGAELLLPGSERTESVLEMCKKNGFLSVCTVAPPPGEAEAPYRPYLALDFGIRYHSSGVLDRTLQFVVDLAGCKVIDRIEEGPRYERSFALATICMSSRHTDNFGFPHMPVPTSCEAQGVKTWDQDPPHERQPVQGSRQEKPMESGPPRDSLWREEPPTGGLSFGEPWPEVFEATGHLLLEGPPQSGSVQARRLGFKKACFLAYEALQEILRSEGGEWTRPHLEELGGMRQRLEGYRLELLAEHDDAGARRIERFMQQQLASHSPRVVCRIERACVIYVPLGVAHPRSR